MDDDDDWDDELLSKIDDLESLHLRAAAERQAGQQHVQPQQPPQHVQHVLQPQQQTHLANDAQWACKSSPAPQPVPAPPSSTFWQPPRQQPQPAPSPPPQQQRRQPPPPPQRPAPTATPWSRTHQSVPAPPTRPPDARRKPAIASSDDDNDDPDAHPQSAWPIAYATQQRRSGEDEQAKTRYLDVLNRARFPAIDFEAAQQFVYPTNYAVREYQLAITEKALYHNTLVSLPTGLGKTLIASVVMYNFYRWFPTGKIVFMAPTKPLVAQQIQACHEIMGIPLTDTAELQGNVPPSRRKTLWRDKRVFFCTPQSMQNDLRHGICEAERFVCLVVDEAHRATGNYAYCCVIQEVERKTPFFRVLALSATPGSKFDVIQDVIKNLRISHIESRSADDADVKKYTHARQEEVIKCTLSSQITEVKAIFLRVFQRITQRLVQGNIIQHRDPEKLSRWYVLQMREKFRQSPSYQANRAAESDLALLVSLLHAKELLTVHGLSSFHEYVNGWIEERETGARLSWSKKEMMASPEFHSLVLSLNAFSTGPATGTAASGKSSSHPKLLKLREVLHEHFQRHATGGSSTRAIVFTQYRTSVTEIVGLLAPLAPLIKVQAFVGQGASGKAKESKGQSQKQQQEIVRKFRDGAFNVLVATCIAEEGLDIGEVDLIVSFDALTSPVRMIQRMGRTGRKRVGKVIILVTEGDEEKKLARSVASAKTVSRAMTTFKSKFVYAKCPRMLPHGVQPALSKLEMTIPEFHASQVGGKIQQRGAGTRASSDESARRRWQLNEIEKAIAAAKYTPADWATRPRNAIFPVTARSRHLLRRVHMRVRGTERVEADAFHVGHSVRSNALRQLVRSIHGVTETDDEVVEIASDDSDGGGTADSDARARSSPAGASAERAGGRTQGLEAAAETQSHAPTHDFSLSAAADESLGGRAAHDASFASEDMHHFSPGWLDAASPIQAAPAASSTARAIGEATPGVSPASAVAASPIAPVLAPAPTPATPATAHASAKTTPAQSTHCEATPAASSPGRKASIAESSPGRRALSSPSPKRGKREKAKRSGANHVSKESAGDAQAFERGEALLQRLRDLVAAAEAVSPASLCSPERETRSSQGASAGSQSTKALGALPTFPRITRRLDFDAVARKSRSVFAGANCVPEAPPPEQFPLAPPPLQPLPDAPKAPSPVLSPDDEPVFALLPTLAVSSEDTHADVAMAEAPVVQTPETPDAITPDSRDVSRSAALTAPKEPSKPKRSLALRRASGSAGDAEQTHQRASSVASRPLPSPLASPAAAGHANAVPSAPRSTLGVAPPTVRAETAPSSTAATATVAPKTAPIVIDIDDFDDFDDELSRAPAARTPVEQAPGKRDAKTAAAPPPTAARASPSQRRARGDANSTATQASTPSDCCAVCTEVESYEDDPIVYCDGCELGVHQFCYGIASVPSGSWFCDSCAAVKDAARARTSPYFGGASAAPPRCALCPVRGGALKKTLCGHWAHVQCFMWLPELQLAPECDTLALGSLKQLDPDRNTLDCSLCHSRTGRGIIQCAYKRCLTAFHVSCAAFAHYKLVQEQPDGGDTLFLAYCPRHARRHVPRAVETHERHAASPPPQEQTPAKPLASAPPASRTTPSPSALLFSPSDGDSAKKFRKFRRLKRKYDASQRTSQSPSGAPTAASSGNDRASSLAPATSAPTWGKRVKRSQQYSEGQKRQATAMARMFIEDDVEVRGDDDDDDYGDDDDDGDDDGANALDDSFINDSSQLLYSPTSPPSGPGKKRKRASPGDMRAIYARSLLESQHDLPGFMRRGQRGFGAVPQHGIINACLQELRSAPSPASSAASLLSPAPSVRSAAESTPGGRTHKSPISLLSPDGPSSSASSTQAATPSTAPPITPEVRRRLEPKPTASHTRRDDDDDGDDFERTSAAPPRFSLLTTASATPGAAASARPSSALPPRSPAPHPSARADTQVAKPTGVEQDQDRSLQERIEANRLRALEKLRERQMKQQRAQAGPPPHAASVAAPVNVSAASSSSHSSTSTLPVQPPAPHASANVVPLAPPPSFALLPPASPFAVASVSDSQANAVPEAPSFSLFPAFASEPAAIDVTDTRSAPQPAHEAPAPPPPPVRPPQVVVHVSSSCSLSALFPTLLASRPPETAVEIDDSLEADVLVSARVAVVTLPHDALAASLARNESDVAASHPRLRTCASVFKRVLVLVRAPDAASASAMSRSPALERLRQSSAATVDVVIRASDEQLCRHVFDVALHEKTTGFSLQPQDRTGAAAPSDALDATFHSRLAYFRSIPQLSLGSALSLSFRFHKFAVAQLPVQKFNPMHWKRMLPWLSDATAKQIQDHVRRAHGGS